MGPTDGHSILFVNLITLEIVSEASIDECTFLKFIFLRFLVLGFELSNSRVFLSLSLVEALEHVAFVHRLLH
jgi:hypothetical protein